MIYDLFLYNGELKMLNFRLHELNDVVDKFIILESNRTFKGDLKEHTFPKHRKLFEKFESKIIYIKHMDNNPSTDPWVNERKQRHDLETGLEGIDLQPADYIMLSDVDEIPDPGIVEKLRGVRALGIATFQQHFFYYNIRCKKKQKWNGTVVFHYGSNMLRAGLENIRNHKGCFQILNGGWHFSYFGDTNFIISKIQSFSHQEFNRSEFIDPQVIEQHMRDGKDLFFRSGEDMEIVNETYLPKHIAMLSDTWEVK